MNKENFGSFVLIAWIIFGLWAGEQILETYGESISFLFPLYMIAWISVIFFGRFAIEWIINKLWKEDQ